jgi:hypothetical protein
MIPLHSFILLALFFYEIKITTALSVGPGRSLVNTLKQLQRQNDPGTATPNARRSATSSSYEKRRGTHNPRLQLSPKPPSSGTICGKIQVRGSSNVVLGFLSTSVNYYGQYGVDPSSRRALTTCYKTSNTSLPFDITTTNGPYSGVTYNLLGATQGFSILNGGNLGISSDYAYIGPVSHTEPGSTPQKVPNAFLDTTTIPEPSESAIWTLQGTSSLVAGYVNPNGETYSPLQFIHVQNDDVIVITGNVTAWSTMFGTNPLVTLSFVR